MRSLRTGLLFWRGNLSRFCVILTPVTDVTGVRETVKKGLCPFLTKGLQPAARTICTPLAYKSHTCSLSCIFCQVHAPTENDQNSFAACGRQTLRGFLTCFLTPVTDVTGVRISRLKGIPYRFAPKFPPISARSMGENRSAVPFNGGFPRHYARFSLQSATGEAGS